MFNLWSYVELIVYFRTVTYKNYPLQPAVVYSGIDGQPITVLIVIIVISAVDIQTIDGTAARIL